MTLTCSLISLISGGGLKAAEPAICIDAEASGEELISSKTVIAIKRAINVKRTEEQADQVSFCLFEAWNASAVFNS